MVKFDSTVEKTGTTQIIRKGHIQFKFGSHNFNILIPSEYFTTHSPPPELSLPLLKFLTPPKKNRNPSRKKIATPPEKNRNPSRKNLNPPLKFLNLQFT